MTDPQHTPAERPIRPTHSLHEITWRSYANELEDYAEALSRQFKRSSADRDLRERELQRQVNTLTEALRSVQDEWGCVVGCKPKAHSSACHIVRQALASAPTDEQLSMPKNPYQTTEIPY